MRAQVCENARIPHAPHTHTQTYTDTQTHTDTHTHTHTHTHTDTNTDTYGCCDHDNKAEIDDFKRL